MLKEGWSCDPMKYNEDEEVLTKGCDDRNGC